MVSYVGKHLTSNPFSDEPARVSLLNAACTGSSSSTLGRSPLFRPIRRMNALLTEDPNVSMCSDFKVQVRVGLTMLLAMSDAHLMRIFVPCGGD